MKKISCIIFLISLVLSGCSTTKDVTTRIQESQDIAAQNNFQMHFVKGKDFVLTTYQRINDRNLPFVFYVEGDGHISEKYAVASDNPTPVNPMLLKLATIDKRPNVVYIARPCQYTPVEMNPKCKSNQYWVEKRIGQEAVDSINDVINTINNGQKFSLVGFSGGGGITVLIAKQNNNVKDIISIGGNLDTREFDEYHNGRGYLTKSLNPINYAKQVSNIPQLHLSGQNDKTVPSFIAENYVKASTSNCVKHQVIPDATHGKGWDKVWSSILNIPLICD